MIESTAFSLFSSKQLRAASVLAITEAQTFDALNTPVPGGLYDARLGPTERGSRCPTCGEVELSCGGHLGHIELPVPCYHPLLFNDLHKFLNLKCFHCHELRLDKLRSRYFATKIALLGGAEWTVADTLQEPPKNKGGATELSRDAGDERERCEKNLDAASLRRVSSHAPCEF